MRGVLCRPFLLLALLLSTGWAVGLVHRSKPFRLPTRVNGVLSRTAIVNAAKGGTKKTAGSQRVTPRTIAGPPTLSKALLMEATQEAQFRQRLIMQALVQQLLSDQKSKPEDPEDVNNESSKVEKRQQSIAARKLEVVDTMSALTSLAEDLSRLHERAGMERLQPFRDKLSSLGFDSVLNHSPDTWKIRTAAAKAAADEYGRPKGFEGLVFYTPRGVPILIGPRQAHKDEMLRRVAQGDDLWFQVEDYRGSRVLLRSSLKRGLRDCRECRQMAADLAVRYSDWYNPRDDGSTKVPVLYCDSRKVAKRGSRVGTMRQRKSLGRLWGNPQNVEVMTQGREPR